MMNTDLLSLLLQRGSNRIQTRFDKFSGSLGLGVYKRGGVW